MTSNKLKIIAIVAMFFDHVVSIFDFQDTMAGMILKTIGRTVAPIMCYLIAEGYHYTSNRMKYITRLLIFAVIAHFPYVISLGYGFFQATSVMWPLALGLIALTAVKEGKLNVFEKLSIVGICCILAIPANWNFVAVLWIVTFGLFYGKFNRQIILFCVVGVIFHLALSYYRFGFRDWYQAGIFLAIPFFAMYNGQRGVKSKVLTWGFYVFYPAHLLILYLLNKYTILANFTDYLR